MRGNNRFQCRLLKRCFFVFAVIAILPLALVYLISTEPGIYRLKTYDYDNDTQFQTVPVDRPLPPSLSKTEIDKIDARMHQRADHLTQNCVHYGLNVHGNDSLHRPNPWEFLISKKHHLVWCNVFKAASTSWMFNFNLLAGYSPQFLKKTNVVPLSLARKRYPRPSVDELQNALNSSVSFLIVRHPFERLLSAYRDKLQFALPHTFHQKLGNQIIRKFRKKKKNNRKTNRWPSFSEFTDFLIDEIRNGKELDMHWTPIAYFCTPCQVKFDVIAKFETLKEDQQYLIEKAGLANLIMPQWKNSGKGKNTVELAMKYYAQLTQTQVKQLYELYKYDFELFEYSPKAFFDIAQPDTDVSTTVLTTSLVSKF